MIPTYPCFAVRNPWVDFAKESMSKHFPPTGKGFTDAVAYCREHDLSGVVLLKNDHSVSVVWENPDF